MRAALASSWDDFDAETIRPRSKREWLQTLKRYAVAAVVAAAPLAVVQAVQHQDPNALKDGYYSTAAIIWALGIAVTTLDPKVTERMKDFPWPGSKKKPE